MFAAKVENLKIAVIVDPMKTYCPRFLLPFLLILLSEELVAQQDTLAPTDIRDLIEDFYQNVETDADFDFNTLLEDLEAFRKRPLNLNRATEEELRDLQLLSDAQITALLYHRQRYGNLVALYELQSIPGFDRNAILRLLPFVGVSGDLDQNRASVQQLLTEGDHTLFLRYTRVLEDQRGYRPFDPEDPERSRYLGNQDRYYLRYRYAAGRAISYGLTAEKDPGEVFWQKDIRRGFDYYSAHLFLRNQGPFKEIALGDYAASLGQGLILSTGFLGGKSATTLTVGRRTPALRPYTSVNEASFLRGAGATARLNDNWELTAFASVRQRDGNLVQNLIEGDTLDDQTLFSLTSILNTGFHRTQNEIEDRNAIRQLTFGGRLAYTFKNGDIRFNVLQNSFDQALTPRFQPYRQFTFAGDRLLNMSLDYTYRFRNLSFFGETARSDNGSMAYFHGLTLPVDRKVGISLVHRHYETDYQALNARPFGEGSNGTNERGWYTGIRVLPAPAWTFVAYFDVFRFPFLRFRTDAPSRGHEWLARLTYTQRRKFTVYAEVRREVKPQNISDIETPFATLLDRDRVQFRLHFEQNVSRRLTLRSRVQYGWLRFGEQEEVFRGYLLYQDLLWKPRNFPVSFNTRFALFDTENFELRFYAFESDVLYAFSVPAYFGRGSRSYVNARWRVNRNLTVEGRIAQTRFTDRNEIGSGLELIEGDTRREVKVQVRYRF